MDKDEMLEYRLKAMLPRLSEKQKRQYAAVEAKAYGYGGVVKVSQLSGLARTTITRGIAEIENGVAELDEEGNDPMEGRERRPGGGRKPLESKYPDLDRKIISLMKNNTYGNPESLLTWTTLSLTKMSGMLQDDGIKVGEDKIRDVLMANGFSLQKNRKMNQVGKEHPDRDDQFRFINGRAEAFVSWGQPVISIDCKKKELVGDYANNGQVWAEKKNPVAVNDHDFELKKAAPFGVYDVTRNEGYVNVGVSSDTAAFAVASVSNWWDDYGRFYYEDAHSLLITCDGGGSNGCRNRLWKLKLQEFSDRTGLTVFVCHFPPGTSKWNKIEHRLFSYISMNWRGKPLKSYQFIVDSIASTTTKEGLVVHCDLDEAEYEKGIKVSNEEMAKINIERDLFHGEWNYCISPRLKS